MKVLFFASDNNIGSGAFRSMAKLVQILKEKYDVNVLVVLPCGGTGKKLLEENGIKYIQVDSFDWIVSKNIIRPKQVVKLIKGFFFNPIAVKKISKIIKDYNVDLIHINTTYSYVGALAALKLNKPFVWHLREALEEDQGFKIFSRKYGYRLINKSTRICAISEFVYEKYKNIFDDKLLRIYNGIDEKDFLFRKSIMDTEKLELLFVGFVCKTKGTDQVIRACQKVIESGFNNIHLNIVGNDENDFGNDLKKYVKDKGLDNYVTFHGVHKNVFEFYKKADVLIMASEAEAFGRTTVEAMMAGCLVIGSNSGATPDILGGGLYGLLYERGNSDELFLRILEVINNPEKYKSMALLGQERALKDFKASENAKNIYQEYVRILDKN